MTIVTKRLELHLLSPTCIAQRPLGVGQPAETLGYLSGTVLRGAIAARWLQGRRSVDLRDAEQRLFRRIFVTGEVVFGNAWPLPDDGRAWVVPRTAWSHKRTGGWFGDGDNGVSDILTRLLRADDDPAGEIPDDLDRLDQEFACEARGRWRALPVRRRLIARTAITQTLPQDALPSPRRGVAAEGQLYSFEALETGQIFAASLRGPEDLVQELIRREALVADALLSVGQGRSRGLGQVRLHVIDDLPEETRDMALLAEQAKAFTRRAGSDPSTMVLLPVTLEADALLRDRYLLPCTLPDPVETLTTSITAAPPPEMTLFEVVQSTRWIGGWEEVRQMPRAPQLAIQQGSVWVYRVPRAALHNAIVWWLQAEARGVGERIAEGYGRVRLLHPLHAEDREKW